MMRVHIAPKKQLVISVAVSTELLNRIIINIRAISQRFRELPEIAKWVNFQNNRTRMKRKTNRITCYSKLRSQTYRLIKRTQSYPPSFNMRGLEFIIQNQYYKFQTNFGFQNRISPVNTGRRDKYLAESSCLS